MPIIVHAVRSPITSTTVGLGPSVLPLLDATSALDAASILDAASAIMRRIHGRQMQFQSLLTVSRLAVRLRTDLVHRYALTKTVVSFRETTFRDASAHQALETRVWGR